MLQLDTCTYNNEEDKSHVYIRNKVLTGDQIFKI